MRSIQLCAVAAALAIPAAGREPEQRRPEDWPERRQQKLMAGPQLGLVFEKEAGRLRRVVGLPGAATLGPVVEVGVALVEASISPRQDLALGITSEGRVVRVVAGSPAEALDAPPSPARIVFSPRGQVAALVYQGEIRVIRPASGAAERAVELGALDGAAEVVAVSDGGTVLVATSAGTVVLFERDGTRVVGAVRHASGAAFLPGSGDALVADDADDHVFLLRGGGFAAIAGGNTGVAGPIAVESSADGRRALVANGRTGTVLSLDLTDGSTELVECACRPEALRRTSQPGTFWLRERLVFEDRPEGRRVVFVAPAEGGQQ
jgi:hypothetical protein